MFRHVLHFGYFDREALCQGQLRQSDRSRCSCLRAAFRRLFGGLPEREASVPGFFDSYGVLSCCPETLRGPRAPVERIVDLVRLTGCDVVYVSGTGRVLVEVSRLYELLEPPREEDDEVW